MPPLISIIVVIWRDAAGLTALLDSIVPHLGPRVELIVIDGGSDESTLSVLRKYDEWIDRWVSETDQGIYDAMNKGLKIASGQYVWHLNAGDRLCMIPERELMKCEALGVDVASF